MRPCCGKPQLTPATMRRAGLEERRSNSPCLSRHVARRYRGGRDVAISASDYLARRRHLLDGRWQRTTRACRAHDERLPGSLRGRARTRNVPRLAALLRENATSLEALLLALPHLFPPTTNQFDPSALDPPTTALPTIWQRFPAFLTFAESAERAAAALREANDTEALSAASARLRGACDACHASFMKPYTPPQTRPEDFEFDFESVLPKE